MIEYRDTDRTIGYCPRCGNQLANVTTDARGYCDRHGWQWCDWYAHTHIPNLADTAGGTDPRPDPRTHPEYWTE